MDDENTKEEEEELPQDIVEAILRLKAERNSHKENYLKEKEESERLSQELGAEQQHNSFLSAQLGEAARKNKTLEDRLTRRAAALTKIGKARRALRREYASALGRIARELDIDESSSIDEIKGTITDDNEQLQKLYVQEEGYRKIKELLSFSLEATAEELHHEIVCRKNRLKAAEEELGQYATLKKRCYLPEQASALQVHVYVNSALKELKEQQEKAKGYEKLLAGLRKKLGFSQDHNFEDVIKHALQEAKKGSTVQTAEYRQAKRSKFQWAAGCAALVLLLGSILRVYYYSSRQNDTVKKSYEQAERGNALSQQKIEEPVDIPSAETADTGLPALMECTPATPPLAYDEPHYSPNTTPNHLPEEKKESAKKTLRVVGVTPTPPRPPAAENEVRRASNSGERKKTKEKAVSAQTRHNVTSTGTINPEEESRAETVGERDGGTAPAADYNPPAQADAGIPTEVTGEEGRNTRSAYSPPGASKLGREPSLEDIEGLGEPGATNASAKKEEVMKSNNDPLRVPPKVLKLSYKGQNIYLEVEDDRSITKCVLEDLAKNQDGEPLEYDGKTYEVPGVGRAKLKKQIDFKNLCPDEKSPCETRISVFCSDEEENYNLPFEKYIAPRNGLKVRGNKECKKGEEHSLDLEFMVRGASLNAADYCNAPPIEGVESIQVEKNKLTFTCPEQEFKLEIVCEYEEKTFKKTETIKVIP